MSTVTGTLTVNAAFLREIKEDNTQLQGMLQTLAYELRRSRTDLISPQWLRERLGELHDQLAIHFSLEETFGYFEDAVSVAPRLSIKADQLQAEHGALSCLVSEMAECVEQLLHRESSQFTIDDVAEDFLRFYQRFRDHENEENKLIMQAFGEDIGVGD
jgi:hemerythrin-like domain-containing protein